MAAKKRGGGAKKGHKTIPQETEALAQGEPQMQGEAEIIPEVQPAAMGEGDVPASQGSQKRKPKHVQIFTEDQEKDIAEWVEEHEIIYNKARRDNKDKSAKEKLWNEKAVAMEVDGKYYVDL